MRIVRNELELGMKTRSSAPRIRFFIGIGGILAAATLLACGSDDPASPEPDPDPVENYGIIETWMGTGTNGLGVDGPILTVSLSSPQDLTFAPDGRAYVLDWNNHRVRRVTNGVSETIIGTGQLGDAPEGLATESGLNHPTHVSFDPSDGNLVLSAWHNSKVMKMDMATGMLSRICGDGRRAFGGDNGPAVDAILDLPVCSVFDPSGNLWITDVANQCVRMIDTSGEIRTVVGTHEPGYSGDGGPATEAQIFMPVGQTAPPVGRACFDADGNYYLADSYNNAIRMVDTNGIIHTVAGIPGQRGNTGDGGPATEAKLYRPSDVAIGPHGDLFIADTNNSLIRKVDKQTGIITTVAGRVSTAENPVPPGYSGDGGDPKEATLFTPYGIEFDAEGNLYIVDTGNYRIRIVRRFT